jgi:hypothetical protein
MQLYTVHLRPGSRGEPDAVLVKDGFCWPALFFSAIWALWHRMWLAAVGFVGAGAVVEAATDAIGLDPLSAAALSLAVALLIAFGANDWRRASLARRGYRLTGIVAASGADAAFRRWFDLNPPAPG